MKENKYIGIVILSFVITLAFAIRLNIASNTDMGLDDSIYSIRAVGWHDSLKAQGQITPFDILNYKPWWVKLSFHDAPPLSFLIQYFFFLIFGVSSFVAKLPYVCFGVATILVIFFSLRKLLSLYSALISTLLISFSPYAIYSAVSGYLEGILIFFVTLTILSFFNFIRSEFKSYKYFTLSFLYLGLALITKYSAMFLIPPIFIFVLWKWKKIKSNFPLKKICIPPAITLIILLPVILFNIQYIKLRGHPDSALSYMFGIKTDDFAIINQNPDNNILKSTEVVNVFTQNYSRSTIFLFFLSLCILIKKLIKKNIFHEYYLEYWYLIFNIFFIFTMLSFGGVTTRWTIITIPLVAMVISFSFEDLRKKQNLYYKLFIMIAIISILSESIHSLNTFFTKKHTYFTRSEYLTPSPGFNQLDEFVRKNIFTTLPPVHSIRDQNDLMYSLDDVAGHPVLLYDDRLKWSAQLWYFARYQLYYHLPVISTSFFTLSKEAIAKINLPKSIEEWRMITGRGILYYVTGISDDTFDYLRFSQREIEYNNRLKLALDEQKFEKIVVNDRNSNPAFYVYKVDKLVEFK